VREENDKMSIEVGSKWVKDGEVVVVGCIENLREDNFVLVWFAKNKAVLCSHVLTERDFLEQYKPYKPVYEYQYAIKIGTGSGNILKIDNVIYYSDEYKHSISGAYYTDNEKKPEHWISYQRLDFTKRERKC
jgi:hypothetical protein